MGGKILDGRALASKIKKSVARKIEQRIQKNLPRPGLAVILVGHDPASESYVNNKQKACEEVGIISTCHRLPADSNEKKIIDLIDQLNKDPAIHGILLQLPLPKQIRSAPLLERIHYNKDVDGFHPYNMGKLAVRHPGLRPCTPYGIMKLLATTQENLTGLNAVVIGASNIVGRPMALELLIAKCTVTVCHRFTPDLAPYVQSADILISATGQPGLVKSQWIKPGAMVIDVGFNKLDDGSISGDIEFNSARERASWITPVPGGVGPMTVAVLLENTLQAATTLTQ